MVTAHHHPCSGGEGTIDRGYIRMSQILNYQLGSSLALARSEAILHLLPSWQCHSSPEQHIDMKSMRRKDMELPRYKSVYAPLVSGGRYRFLFCLISRGGACLWDIDEEKIPGISNHLCLDLRWPNLRRLPESPSPSRDEELSNDPIWVTEALRRQQEQNYKRVYQPHLTTYMLIVNIHFALR